MIAAHEVELNRLYEVTNETDHHDIGSLVYAVSVLNERGFRNFKFLWLSGAYEGRLVEGGRVSFNTMMPLKMIA